MASVATRVRPALRRVVPAGLRHDAFVWLTRNQAVRAVALRLPGTARVEGGRFEIDVGVPDAASRLSLWLGVHESSERQIVREALVPGLPVVELGSGIGTVSFTAWRAAAPPRMILLEANPRVADVLRRNMQSNSVAATVVEAAIAYDVESVTFEQPRAYWVGGGVAAESGESADTYRYDVGATTLGAIVDEHLDPGTHFQLITDIEGTEWELFDREADLIEGRADVIVAELHALDGEGVEAVLDRARQVLGRMGFEMVTSRGPVAAFAKE